MQAAPIIEKGARKLILNGCDTYFWKDVWLTGDPLMRHVIVDISLIESYCKVADLWLAEVGWNWDVLDRLLPELILRKLEAVLLCEDESLKDGIGVFNPMVISRWLLLIWPL